MKVLFAALLFCAFVYAQDGVNAGSTGMNDTNTSLADVAKKSHDARAASAKKVYTNDDMPNNGGVSVVGEKPGASQPNYSRQASDPVREQHNLDAQWHNQIEAQKATISNLEQQLNIAEANLAHSTHYYEVNPNPRYAQYKAQVENLKQQIEGAKSRLAEIQDEAHKAGVNKAYD